MLDGALDPLHSAQHDAIRLYESEITAKIDIICDWPK